MNPRLFSLLPLFSLLVLSACGPAENSTATDPDIVAKPLSVIASNAPLAYFASRIGGKWVHSVYPGPDDEDPAFWVPDDRAVQKMQAADLILLNGATYEKWLPQVSLPDGRIVDTSRAFAEVYLESGESSIHSHGPEGDHSHEGTAFTTWIDFDQAGQQAASIWTALNERIPEQVADLESNYEDLKRDLGSLDRRMKGLGKAIGSQPLVVSHPVYQYWARRYDLNVKAVLWEPEVTPSKEQWVELQDLLKTHPAAYMIWEGSPASASVERLQELNVESLIFAPGGASETGISWLELMESNLEALENQFGETKT